MAKIMASEGGDEDNAKIMNSNFHPVKNLNSLRVLFLNQGAGGAGGVAEGAR